MLEENSEKLFKQNEVLNKHLGNKDALIKEQHQVIQELRGHLDKFAHDQVC